MVSSAKTLYIVSLGSKWRYVVSFSLRPLHHRKRAHGFHWIRGWVSPSAGLERIKISAPGGSEHESLVTTLTELSLLIKSRWEDKIKMNLKERGWEGVD
jgi:hypothetical protein